MKMHATTILTVRQGDKIAMGGDGQVTMGSAIMKSDARKIRKLLDGKVLCGFAGSTADAFALLETVRTTPERLTQQCPTSGDGIGQTMENGQGLAAA